MRQVFAFFLSASVGLLTGCALQSSTSPSTGPRLGITGTIHGGQQPVVGARIYLLAAGTSGYGGTSTSLLTSGAGSDALGTYVLSGLGGSYSITGSYSCTPGAQAYLYAADGNPGAGSNPSLGLMAALGNCPVSGSYAANLPVVSINEVTTVAAAYSLAGFATDAIHISSSGSAAALTGVQNAFATAGNLADLHYGFALTATPNANGSVPQAEINTLANILAACINSSGFQLSCSTLFSNALSGGTSGTMPTETASAMINIAHHPGLNISALYGLQSAAAPFQPTLSAPPNDFSVGIVWNIASGNAAFDSAGNLWTTDTGLLEYSNTGTLLSPAAGFTGGGVSSTNPAGALSIDPANNIWLLSSSTSTQTANGYVSEFSNSGAPLSSSYGFNTVSVSQPISIAIDGAGAVWTGDQQLGILSKLNNAGVLATSSINAFGQPSVNNLAIDNTGNVWVASGPYRSATGKYALTEVHNSGVFLQNATQPNINGQSNLSIDAANDVWGTLKASASTANQIFKLSPSGAPLNGSPFSGNTAVQLCGGTQIDGAGNLWCASDDSIAEISSTGAAISPSAGYIVQNALGAQGIAIDSSGNVWTSGDYIAIGNNIKTVSVELIGAAAPVVTPTSLAIQMGKLGTLP